MKNFFIVIMSLLALTINAQNAYYSNEAGNFEAITIDGINTSEPLIYLSWQQSENFQAPYSIIQISASDTINIVKSNIPAAIIDISSENISTIYIIGIGNESLSFNVNYHRSYFIPIIIGAIIIVLIIVFFSFYKKKKTTTIITDPEQDKLRSRRTQKFDCVTILFCDIQGFTKIAEHMNPEQLVDELDRYFIFFDELVEKYSVEKIKTIGDAYMCAGGVPNTDSANPIEVVLVGLGMIAYVNERRASSQGFWNIRVGINTGSVISGTLGFKKKSFDIWGDSVNTASRMESSSIPGEINITGDTYQKISEYFVCEHRGRMPVKYKGEVDMYFVKGLKPEYAEADSKSKPNALLLRKIREIKVCDLDSTMESAIKERNSYLAEIYQNFILSVEILSKQESLSEENNLVVKVIAIAAFAISKVPNTYKQIIGDLPTTLSKMHFSEESIDTINVAVNRISLSKRPSSHIEEIISDAKYAYLGKKEFVKIIMTQYNSMIADGRKISKKDWFNEQRHILSTIGFYTTSAKQSVDVPREEQLTILEQIIRL